jgi:glycosyltransferase involved in cell wall biosynthesis
VLDLRDDWVGAPVFLGKKLWRQKIESVMEALVVRHASAVVTVTPQSYRLYKERYARLNKPGKFHLIPNGCDLDEFTRLKTRERRIVSEKFLILSAAWWYRKGHRDLRPFLWGLEEFFKRREDARGRVDVVMLGNSVSEEHEQALADLHMDGFVRRLGSVGRVELIEWLWKADLFLLVQPAGNTTAISGTLYEYWATGKAPILLIAEKGASSTLVEDNRIGGHFHFGQVEQIADFIERHFDTYAKGSPAWISRDGVETFDRKALADEMAGIWMSLILGK